MADVVEVMAASMGRNCGKLYNDRAAAMIADLDAAGYAVVPKEPTMAMLRAFQDMTDDNGSCLVIPGYRAMLSASQVKP